VNRIFLLSCVGQKQPNAARAADLYTSAWFVKARRRVEETGDPWFILSAEHGLLPPEQVIEPYDSTLNTMPAAERRDWARRVQDQMDVTLPAGADEIIVLAGGRYRENLMPYLRRRFLKVTVPMKGLRIGEQLKWLDNAAPL